MEIDEIVVLPSGTELSIEAALGDLARAEDFLAGLHFDDEDWQQEQDADLLATHLHHVGELLLRLAGD